MTRGLPGLPNRGAVSAPESGSEGPPKTGGYRGKRHVGADERIDHQSHVVEINKRVGTAGRGVAANDPGDSATAGAGDAGPGTAGEAGPGKPRDERHRRDAAERAGGGPTSTGSAPAQD